jgi:hypothetical protein
MKVRQWLACSLFGTLSAALLASMSTAGCGSSSPGEQSDAASDTKGVFDNVVPTDHGGQDSKGDELANLEGGGDGGADAPLSDASPDVSSSAISLVNNVDAGLAAIQVQGITDDNKYVVYYGTDAKMNTGVFAVPIGGGAPVTIAATVSSGAAVVVVRSIVFVWDNVSKTGVGTLSLWASATGVTKSATSASSVGVVAVSPDSTKVVFSSAVNTAGTLGSLVGANADGTGQVTLIANTGTAGGDDGDAGAPTFIPQIDFPNNSYVVASHQETGSLAITVSSWDTATWLVKADLITPTLPYSTTLPIWQTNTGGTTPGAYVAALSGTNQLEVIPVAGGAPLNIDVLGTTTFVIDKAGDSIVYGNATAKSLSTSPLPVINAQPILATGFGGFYSPFGLLGPSPDGTQVLYYKTEASASSAVQGVDLYLVPNAASGTPTTLVSSTSGAVFGDIFTADSKYALYITSLTSAGGAVQGAIGDLNAWDITNSKQIVVSNHAVWDSNTLTGSVVLYNDNFAIVNSTDTEGIADLKTVDVSAATLAPTLIQAMGDQNYFISADKKTVVFTLELAGNSHTAGLYAYPL